MGAIARRGVNHLEYSTMLKEIRQIVFPQPDLLEALTALRKRQGVPIPAGTVKSVEVRDNGEVEAVLKLEAAGTGKEVEVQFRSAELAAAMLAYCLRSKIPLPRTARKSVEIFDEQAGLVITLDGSQQTKPSSAKPAPCKAADKQSHMRPQTAPA